MRKQSEMEKKNGVVSCGATKAHSNGSGMQLDVKGREEMVRPILCVIRVRAPVRTESLGIT